MPPGRHLLRVAATAAVVTVMLALAAAPAHADKARSRQWYLKALNVAAVHKISQGKGVTVAVIDSGVDPHPDLRGNLLSGANVAPGDSGDGREDLDGHGTLIAGFIAAHGRGGNTGTLGIAPQAKILPICIDRPGREGNNVDVANAIRYAIERHVDVINISLVGSPDPELSDAVRAALAADIVVVAGAGNRPRQVIVSFPAAIDGVLAVGASDKRGNRAAVSVTGQELVLLAPGVDVYGTGPDGDYLHGDAGTSVSAAIVSGAAALIRSKYPDLSAREVVHRLTATATDKGAAGRDPEYGYGVLNLVKALTADVPALEPSSSPSASDSAAPSLTEPAGAVPPTAEDQDDGGPSFGAVLLGLLLVAAVASIAVGWALRRRKPAATPVPSPAGFAPPSGSGQRLAPPPRAPYTGEGRAGHPPGSGPAQEYRPG